ncbi:response regulator receiver protein [Burkholderia multivorans]|uniref:response regulator receiver protein n=1 Tax=Burkholderia multivorans TaxID=87883 RepID=UPI0021C0434E|nr:response regulator receiver protein [Burkholderia multivorans]
MDEELNGGALVDLAGAFDALDGDGEIDNNGNTDPGHSHFVDDPQAGDAESPAGEGEQLDLSGDADQHQNGDDPEGDDPVFEIPVGDGQKVSKKLSELIADASKYHGANRKFEEAAAIRKDAEQKLAQLPEREKQLGIVLEHYIRAHEALMAEQQPNWERLLAENPTEYVRARHAWEARQRQMLEARQVQEVLAQRNAEAEAVSKRRRLDEAQTKLIQANPTWADPKKAEEGARAIDQYLESQGIPANVRSNIDSAEVLLIAQKAMLYDQAIARQKAAQQGGNQPVPRVARPGPARTTTKTQQARANAEKAFAADPSEKTLANFFM